MIISTIIVETLITITKLQYFNLIYQTHSNK